MYTIFARAPKAFYTMTLPTMKVENMDNVKAIIKDVKRNYPEYKNWTFSVITPDNKRIIMN